MVDSGGGPLLLDQSEHGNDYWQADFDQDARAWSITYNVPLDMPGDQPQPGTFDFGNPPPA